MALQEVEPDKTVLHKGHIQAWLGFLDRGLQSLALSLSLYQPLVTARPSERNAARVLHFPKHYHLIR